MSPLMTAALHGSDSVVALLLDYGADPDIGDIKGRTALMAALIAGILSTIELLARVTRTHLGGAMTKLAEHKASLSPGVLALVSRAGEDHEAALRGLEAAATYGAVHLLETLLCDGRQHYPETTLHTLLQLSIESDTLASCEAIKRHLAAPIPATILRAAEQRGNWRILQLLTGEGREEMETKARAVRDTITATDILTKVPKTKEFSYCNKRQKMAPLLAGSSATYEQVLQELHQPQVHYGEPCPTSCNQQDTCARVTQAHQLVMIIKDELAKRNPLFGRVKAEVVGSLREGTRVFEVDEMDVHLYFENSLAPFLTFDTTNQTIKVHPSIANTSFSPYIKSDGSLDSYKLFKDFVSEVYSIIPSISPPAGMLALTTDYTPCLTCMMACTEWGEPQAQRCRHSCEGHKEEDGCTSFTSPCLHLSKMGLVISVGWESGHYLDIDFTCPTIPTTTKYGGNYNDARMFLKRTKPRGWLEEFHKMESLTGHAGNLKLQTATTWGVICRLISSETVVTQQDKTLKGIKRELYVILKVLKYCTQRKSKDSTMSKVSSYTLKIAIDSNLKNRVPERSEFGSALRAILQHETLRGRFDSVSEDLEAEGITRVEVGEEGLIFHRDRAQGTSSTQEQDLVELDRLVQKVNENWEERRGRREERALSLAQNGEESTLEIPLKEEEKLSSAEVRAGLAKVHQSCTKFSPQLGSLCVPTIRAHITLLVTHVPEDKLQVAKDLVNTALKTNSNLAMKFEVKLKGVNSFNETGIYAEVGKGSDTLKDLNKVLESTFRAAGFRVTYMTRHDKYTPHVTIMRGGVIPRQAYQDVADSSFGTEEITGIQLLSMTKPYTLDGYYFCEGDFR